MSNVLRKLNNRVKQLKRLHPGASRENLMKRAGKEYRAGKLKNVSKMRKVGKAKTAAPKKAKRKTVVRTVVVHKVRRIKVKHVRRRARVSGKGVGLMPVVAVAALGIGAYLLLKPKTTQAAYQPTGNIVRDNQASNVIAYATAAGLTITAITKLIEALNNSSDQQVAAAASNPQQYADFFSGD